MEKCNDLKCLNCISYLKRINELEKLLNLKAENKEYEEGHLDLSEKRITELINKHYDIEYFYQGNKGITLFIYSHIIRDTNNKILYKCINQNKRLFQFYD